MPELRERFGTCLIHVPRKSIPILLIEEALNPFYLFQVFSVILWFWDGYEKYAICILVISIASVAENLYETVSNINSIRKIALYECNVQVQRIDGYDNAILQEISSDQLVPGDVIVVPESTIMPCDAVLMSGQCIVNESMLTGESVPVIKNCISLTEERYSASDYELQKKHTLYGGTLVIQSK